MDFRGREVFHPVLEVSALWVVPGWGVRPERAGGSRFSIGFGIRFSVESREVKYIDDIGLSFEMSLLSTMTRLYMMWESGSISLWLKLVMAWRVSSVS